MAGRRNKNKKLHEKRRRKARRKTEARPKPARRAYPPLARSYGPSVLDQMAVFIAEPELGLRKTTLPRLIKLAEQLPFEPAMLHVARLGAHLEPVLRDAAGQWQLAQGFFGGRSNLLRAYAEVLREHPDRSIFSPQALVLLARVLIDHAADGDLRDLEGDEIKNFQDAVLGAHSALEGSLDGTSLSQTELVLAYEIQAATFFRRPQLLEEMARHQALVDLAINDARLDDGKRPPVAKWLTLGALGLTPEQQFGLGFGLGAMTRSFGQDPRPRVLAAHAADLIARQGLEPAAAIAAVSATRAEYQVMFAGGSRASMRWELRPFKARPFLRLEHGDLLLLSPVFMLSWLGEGFHYRAMTYAQTLGDHDLLSYTTYVGHVVERYALDLAEAAVASHDHIAVFGEQPYNRGQDATSDVAMAWGDEDVVLFEVHARRVAATAAVAGSAEAATTEVSRLLVGKTEQLGLCMEALLDGRASLPDVDMSRVRRIWPVVVSMGHVMQTPTLWDYIRATADAQKSLSFGDTRVMPLQIFDMEDYEKALGLVEAGFSLPDMLESKASGPYRERDWPAWLHGDPEAPSDKPRLSALKERFWRVSEQVVEETKNASDDG